MEALGVQTTAEQIHWAIRLSLFQFRNIAAFELELRLAGTLT